jgi:hypothetical protein
VKQQKLSRKDAETQRYRKERQNNYWQNYFCFSFSLRLLCVLAPLREAFSFLVQRYRKERQNNYWQNYFCFSFSLRFLCVLASLREAFSFYVRRYP